MLLRFLRGAIRLHPLRLGLVVLSTAMGSSIAASLVAVSLQVEDRIGAELRSYGANVVIEPAETAAPSGSRAGPAWLAESDLGRMLTIFWRHNIVGIAPSLTAAATVEGPARAERALLAGLWFDRRTPRPGGDGELRAGVLPLFPYWEIEGAWPAPGADGEAVLGRALAARLGARVGDSLTIAAGAGSRPFRVSGVVKSGGLEEDQALVNLESAQRLLGLEGRISRALVSVVTVPLDAFGRREPSGMTKREYEKWFCTPYITSVARQLEQSAPGSRARPVWSMAEAEARVLSRLNVLMLLLAVLTLLAAALAVASTFAARVMGRRAEIALMRACGASAGQVALVLGSEVLALGAAGGIAGTFLALSMIQGLGRAVFGTPLSATPAVLPLALGGSILVAALGAIWPVRRALRMEPARDLKEAA